MSIVLIGYRGSGKTSVGRRVAERLGWTFVDADERIVQRAGKTIKAIFAEDGEPAFRDLEASVVEALLPNDRHVISLGGGAVMRETTRQRLRSSGRRVVYLRADAQTLHDRIHADTGTAANRPALTHLGGGIEEIRQLLEMREPGYQSVMTHELDVSKLTIDQAADQILRMLPQ